MHSAKCLDKIWYLLNVQLSVSIKEAIKITSRVMIFPFHKAEQYFLYIQCFSKKDTERKEECKDRERDQQKNRKTNTTYTWLKLRLEAK